MEEMTQVEFDFNRVYVHTHTLPTPFLEKRLGTSKSTSKNTRYTKVTQQERFLPIPLATLPGNSSQWKCVNPAGEC